MALTALLNLLQPFWWLIGNPIIAILIPVLISNLIKSAGAKDFFKEKIVLITGASSGLGEALAHAFYKKGAKVILCARRVDELERVKRDLLALTCKCETFTPEVLGMDVSDIKSIPGKAKEALDIHGRIDVLVNNAGMSFRGEVCETDCDVHMKVMMVNYFGQICLTKAILPSLISQKSGQVVMVSSVQGRIGIPFRSAYAASKHALQAYSDCLRAEVAKHGVKVIVASPGYINTNLSLSAVTASGDTYGVLDDTTASGYQPRDVAERILSAIVKDKNELIIAPIGPWLAIILRTVCPQFYFHLMSRRAAKLGQD